jgi:hypothetical protein
MHKMKLVALALTLGASIPVVARAGVKATSPVQVNLTSRYAFGSMGSARNSVDSTQQIGCEVDVLANGIVYGGCSAVSAASVGAGPISASCSFYNQPGFAAVAQSVSSDSFIIFTWDANGVCQQITSSNFSLWEPKK